MRKSTCCIVLLMAVAHLSMAQSSALTVEKIMRDPKWIGTSPSNLQWSFDGRQLYFNWNPEKAQTDSLYFITRDNLVPQKASYQQRQNLLRSRDITYNSTRSSYVYDKDGDIFLADVKTGKERRITQTMDVESDPLFSFNDTKVVYTLNQNLYAWDIASGLVTQLTNFQRGNPPPKDARKDNLNTQEKWLKEDQLKTFDVLRSRKQKRDNTDSMASAIPKRKTLRTIYLEDKSLFGTTVSPDGRFITYRLYKASQGKTTIVPNYVTESGFTEDIPGRTKVGNVQGTQELFVFDTEKDSLLPVKLNGLAGIRDLPEYLHDYPALYQKKQKDSANRAVDFLNPLWSEKGTHVMLDLRAQDNKDRWICLLNPATGKISLLDRQHDSAWIGGPGIGGGFGGANAGWIDENTCWFESEATGYAHLYSLNVITGVKKALTTGQFEVQQAELSKDKKFFFISTNEVHPGEQQFYRLPITGGKPERITGMTGANLVSLSPDEKQVAYLYSYSNKPWELYLQENKPGAKPQQITQLAASDEFKAYAWKDPQVLTITARDGAPVYARLYKPSTPVASRPAVIFVHGAGYLQNAHKWWSSYFREYMFNNMLADKGYTVLDIDYRGSAGYGRNWRTGIYRFMGGKDLTDQVDAAKYLVDSLGVDAKHIGLYGGSYGGFITLMALFTTPDVFAAGAALRPVTDWAQYNHGYTSNILNEPFTDSLAYRRSSPLYYANGLKGHLLICHGIVDTNVNFQDAVKLSQRLIELRKDNWDIIGYPMEDHGFVEPSSWTDEYKRIFKLFETNLK
ncbi:MAG TPA: alpha/beta fold hydrolase [Chitinophagaceae bacterium]|nr:alpha/beta fold hydrolase [Chitinophagaceae bacterium]